MLIPNDSFRTILDTLLAEITANLEKSTSEKLTEGFYSYFPGYEVITTKRIAAFIAQAAHETGGFKWFYELGGKSYFNKYEPETSIERDKESTKCEVEEPAKGVR